MAKDAVKAIETRVIGERNVERMMWYRDHTELEAVHLWMVGISHVVDKFEFVRPWPAFTQVLVTTGGVGEVFVEGNWHRLEPGQAYLTPARAPHAYRRLGQEVWDIAWVHMDESVSQFGEPRVATADVTFLSEPINGMLRERDGPNTGAAKLNWARLIDIGARRLLGPVAKEERISSVWAKVAQDLSHRWELTTIAKLAHLSPEHFRRKCQLMSGCSPMEYLRRLRMRRAGELLVSTNLKVDDVAQRVGYESGFAFAVAFKREMRMTPAQYRK